MTAASSSSSSLGPRALAALMRQSAARPRSTVEAASAASLRALPVRARGADEPASSITAASGAAPPSAPAAAPSASPCCHRCGRPSPCACACACGRCGRVACRCGPSYGAALPAGLPLARPGQRLRQQQQRAASSWASAAASAAPPSSACTRCGRVAPCACGVRGVSWSAATSTAAEPKSSSSEEQRQQQQGAAAAGGEEQQQQQQDNSSSQQQEGEPQHLFSRLREKVFGGGENASSDTTTTAESAADRARRLLRAAAREVADAVLPREERVSLTRAYDGPVWQPGAESSSSTTTPSSTALAVAPAPPPSAAKKLLDDLRARFGSHPLFARLTAAASQAPGSAAAAGAAASASAAAQAAARKAQDAVDALREKYETSDHPAVHRAEEVKERLFGATEAAEALAEALRRDPTFDVAKLLASVKHDARTVVGAFLAHDLATLKQYAGSELLERLGGVFAHFDAQGGLREDPTILFVGDPELVEVRNVEGDPMVVVQFACQQIKATRDKFGNVVDGSPNSIQRVFYFWGLVQEKQGVVLPDGRPLPPRWALRDMMWQSVLALV